VIPQTSRRNSAWFILNGRLRHEREFTTAERMVACAVVSHMAFGEKTGRFESYPSIKTIALWANMK
jgi:hypothetical protein